MLGTLLSNLRERRVSGLLELIEALRELADILGKVAEPNSITNLEATRMARDVVLTWTQPTTRTDGTPLPAEQIAYTRIDARVSGIQEWTEINRVGPPTQQVTLAQLSPGTREFRAVVVDVVGRESAPSNTASATVPSDAAPSAITNLTATVQ